MATEKLHNGATATEAANSHQNERKRFWNKMIAGGAIVFGAAWALGAMLVPVASWASLSLGAVAVLEKLALVGKTIGGVVAGVGVGGRVMRAIKTT